MSNNDPPVAVANHKGMGCKEMSALQRLKAGNHMINDLVRPAGSAEASMMTNDVRRLQKAIQQRHGCQSAHVATIPLTEQHSGKILWQGEVEIFDLHGHATAQRCYAWTSRHNGGKEDYAAVLEVPPVDSPRSAVRAVLRQVAN